ncbi:MAG: UDP-N-acetylmuramate dehydrogenase [Gemmataceae bacterium]
MPLTGFPEITKRNEPLAPYTHLKTGGPAECLVQPRTVAELGEVLKACHQQRLPMRMLGGGNNLLIRDDAVPGVVIRLTGPAFSSISVKNNTIHSGGGAALFDLIAAACRANLRGLETLIGIRGTVGGSVRCNVGDRTGEIATCVRRVCVLNEAGVETVRTKDELTFGENKSDLDEPAILWVEFELIPEKTETILKRMRKAWISRKESEPLSFQSAVRMFRNPAGQSAATLIERAGLAKSRIGGAEISDRNGNYVVAHPGTTASDILRMMDHVRDTVKSSSGIALERELNVW